MPDRLASIDAIILRRREDSAQRFVHEIWEQPVHRKQTCGIARKIRKS
jgi:hypothetical protein